MIVKIRSYLCLTLILIFLAACAEPTSTPKAGPTSTSEINRHPAAADYSIVNPHPTLPAKFDSNLGNFFQNDYRSSNLSKLDLTQSLQGLLYSDFDTQIVWPPAEMLPVGFDPKKIMELGKDPGLGIRQLRRKALQVREWV